jgi:hypothetical protein
MHLCKGNFEWIKPERKFYQDDKIKQCGIDWVLSEEKWWEYQEKDGRKDWKEVQKVFWSETS